MWILLYIHDLGLSVSLPEILLAAMAAQATRQQHAIAPGVKCPSL